jgi:hypothetical protein
MDSLREFSLFIPSGCLAIVYVVGLVISATKMGLYRKAAGLAVGGFATMLVGQLARIAATVMTLPSFRGSTSIRDLGFRLTVINLTATALILAGTILLLLAIFAGRSPERR